MKHQMIRPEFIESAPKQLSDGVIYISDRFRTALHKCCCGCGKEVVTPLNPAGWSYLLEDGKVTLKPSIGNWSFPCKSHYLITRNQVVWAHAMSDRQIAQVKARDARDQRAYIARCNQAKSTSAPIISRPPEQPALSWFSLLRAAIRRWLS
jgi:hypothetical protein